MLPLPQSLDYEAMEYVLVICFLTNGLWVAGDNLPTEGRSALPYPTLEH